MLCLAPRPFWTKNATFGTRNRYAGTDFEYRNPGFTIGLAGAPRATPVRTTGFVLCAWAYVRCTNPTTRKRMANTSQASRPGPVCQF